MFVLWVGALAPATPPMSSRGQSPETRVPGIALRWWPGNVHPAELSRWWEREHCDKELSAGRTLESILLKPFISKQANWDPECLLMIIQTWNTKSLLCCKVWIAWLSKSNRAEFGSLLPALVFSPLPPVPKAYLCNLGPVNFSESVLLPVWWG